jgi:hypothetical protein
VTEATPEQALLALTQAAVGAARGEHPPAPVAQAIEQLAGRPDLPQGYAPYLAALAQVVRDPRPDQLESAGEAAEALLEALAEPAPRIGLCLGLARLFDEHDQPGGAVRFQAQAIAELRQGGDEREAWQTLSVALYNQAGFLAQVGRFDEAVAALEEVVAIDQRLDLPDLASDQAALEGMKRRRDGLPPLEAAAGLLAQMEAQLAELPPEAQEQVRQAMAQLADMSPEEQEAWLLAQRRGQIEAQADQVVEAALDAWQNQRVEELLPVLDQAATHYAEDEAEGSPYAQLAGFIQAVAALLRGTPPPPVPEDYAEKFVALQQAMSATDGAPPPD